MEVSSAFRRFRKEFGLTQEEVAECANVDVRMYQNYEDGRVVPSIAVVVRIAKNYNVSLDYLVGITDNPKMNR